MFIQVQKGGKGRYAHLAADHLRTAACRLDGTFTSQSAKVHLLRAA